jgi:hypothetical protein
MTDDIAALILEIQARIDEEGCGPEWAAGTTLDHRIIGALERLTTPPPPEDRIAQATKLLRERIPLVLKYESGAAYSIMVGLEDLARDVLALASPENERLKELLTAYFESDGVPVIERLQQRIRELEAECDILRNSVDAVRNEYVQRYMDATARIIELEAEGATAQCQMDALRELRSQDGIQAVHTIVAERDAIRAKTFDECEELAANREETFHTECRRMAARDIRHAIRARAQTEFK